MHTLSTSLMTLLLLTLSYNPSFAGEFFLKINSGEQKKIHADLEPTQELNNQPVPQPTKPEELTLTSPSGLKVPALFFDRGSNVALVLGQGLPAPKESMLIYTKLFQTYDVIVFDYRWHESYWKSLSKSLLLGSPTQSILLDEEKEVRVVLDFLQRHKKYEKVVGLGECYSNFLFAKIQADDVTKKGSGLFTHLIFDSCWHSYKSFAESICDDPWLPLNPRHGGAPTIIKKGTSILKWPLLKLIFTFLHDVSIEEHLAHLGIPALFIYGTNDLMIQREHFEKTWQATNENSRAAFITPYRHIDNLGNKKLYQFVVERFVQSNSTSEFADHCKDLVVEK